MDSNLKEFFVFLLAMFVASSLAFNAMLACAALEGSHTLAQAVAESGGEVDLAAQREAVLRRFEHTLRGKSLYFFEWMGGAWAAVSMVAAFALAITGLRLGRRRLLAIVPLGLSIALLGIAFANWATVSKIAIWLE